MENEEELYDHWKDEEFLNEMQSRVDDTESGRVKGIPWEEVKARTEELFRNKKDRSANPIDFDSLSDEELKRIIDACGVPPDDYYTEED